jgi:hypothetical protein
VFLSHFTFFVLFGYNYGMSLKEDPKKRSSIYDLPDALDEDPSDVQPDNQSPTENEASSISKSDDEKSPQKEGDSVAKKEEETTPFYPSEYDSEEPASDEEFEAKNKRGDDSDMNEKFGRFAKAADIHSIEVQKEAHELEMKLHKIDLSQKTNIEVWANPILKDIIKIICKQLGETQDKVVLAAMLHFYRSVMQDERRMLHDLGFLLDNLALQNQELCMETSSLEDLAQQAIELEASPYFSPDEETLNGMDNYDYSKDQKGGR